MSRLDAMIATDYTTSTGDNKTRWTKIGTAWPAKQGPGYSITLDALPLQSMSRDGKLECRILLREPLPARDDAPRGGRQQAPAGREELNDEVPF